MKKRSTIILAALLAASVAGIGAASAFIINDATNKSLTDQADDVLILKWGDEASVAAIENLSPGNAQLRSVSLKAPSRNTETNKGYFHISVKANESATINGLSVEVKKDLAFGTYESGSSADNIIATLNSTTASYSVEVTADAAYYLRVTIAQADYDKYVAATETGYTSFGGTITLSYDQNASISA